MVEDAVESHVLVSGLFVIETGILKNDAEALARFFLAGTRIKAIQHDAAAGRLEKGGEHFDGGCLARAVRSEEGEDLALGYVKGDIADGGEIPKGLYQVLNLNHASLKGLHNDTERYRFECQGKMIRTNKNSVGSAGGFYLRAGAFVNDRPRHDKFVSQLAEASRKERFRQRRIDLAALSKQVVDPLCLFGGISRKVKVDAFDFLKHCWRDVVCDQYC